MKNTAVHLDDSGQPVFIFEVEDTQACKEMADEFFSEKGFSVPDALLLLNCYGDVRRKMSVARKTGAWKSAA